ncbi:MAG TPA: MlaD family protein [Solirubrobacterales bacterium]|nr:MlaD family protein [Solirubrobacterales bacterium]
MRRIAGIILVCAAAFALLFVASGAEEGETYEVRAIFDNSAFLAPGMDVRIAGANVGSVAELDVTFPDEPAREDGSDDPGKAVVVMQIDDPGFQDFRQDASCQIFPQSLLGEKYVECEPTQPRSSSTAAPPALEEIPEGEPGEGQYLLPLERNGKSVDIDLVNNIMEEPYPERFRLIINDLGIGLAARGDEIEEIIERSNPALRELNLVLETLARQNDALETLASDSDTIMTELAAEREHVASFINEATTTGEATLAEQAAFEETFERFPGFLRELRSTMTELQGFSDAATPVFADLRVGAPALTRASEALGPFSDAATVSFTTLGDAAEDAGPALRASDPVIKQTRDLAKDSAPAVSELATLLTTMRKTGGFQGFLETLYGLGGTVNPYDSNGHFTRAVIPTNVCFDYTSVEQSGCEAKFVQPTSLAALRQLAYDVLGPTETEEEADEPRKTKDTPAEGAATPDEETATPEEEAPETEDEVFGTTATSEGVSQRSMRDLLEFMIGSRNGGGR